MGRVNDFTPDEPLPATLAFTDDSTAGVCGPEWEGSWFKAALTLEVATKRLRWDIDLHNVPVAQASAMFVDTGHPFFELYKHNQYAIHNDRARRCEKRVEINLGKAANPLRGEAVLTDEQVASLMDGRWAIRVEEGAGKHVFLGSIWLPHDYVGTIPLRGTLPFQAEFRGVRVEAQIEKRTKLLTFSLVGRLGGEGNVSAVRLNEDGRPAGEAAMAETLETYEGKYVGRTMLTERQMAALLGHKLRIEVTLGDRPGRTMSGLLALPGYSDQRQMSDAEFLLWYKLYRAEGGKWSPGK